MNALNAERMLGYILFCERWKIVRDTDGSATLTVRMENRGVAPMYYAWPVEAEALDGDGKIVGRGKRASLAWKASGASDFSICSPVKWRSVYQESIRWKLQQCPRTS